MASDNPEYTTDEIVEALNIFWLLFGSTLVFFMQVGFSMLEVGSVQEKSTKNVLIKNAFDVCITAMCWSVWGHALAYGKSIDSPRGVFGGTTGFFLFQGDGDGDDYAVWLFNWAFVSTAATIVSGAVAERIHFHCYIVFVFFLSLLVYPAVVHWTWSDDGFMSPRRGENLLYGCGVVDFAGSGVVHCTGGMCALVALFLLGPRDGVTFVNGARKAPPGQSPSFQTLGTLALWFGWFGFNGCSTGVLVGSAHVAARAMLNTALGGATGGIMSAVLSVYSTRKQLAVTSTLNGILAGLVGVTANCATVQMEGAFAIGAVSGCIYHFGARLLVRLQVDDVVQAVPVHLFAGMWGILAAGFFTVPKLYSAAYAHDEGMERRHECAGLLYGGSGKQLGAQLTFLVVALTWVLVTAGSLFYVFHLRKELRIGRLVELVGMDQMYHNDNPDQEAQECDMNATMGGADQRIKAVAGQLAGLPPVGIPSPGGTVVRRFDW